MNELTGQQQQLLKPLLIAHGGAWNIPNECEEDHIKGLQIALETVYPLLEQGISAEEAVVQVIKILENDPTFDAGYGSFLNIIGQVEMDASIMNGKTKKAGSVAAIQNVKNPIQVAQGVMNQTEHVLLVGQNALQFAKQQLQIEEVDPEKELLCPREIEFLKQIRNNNLISGKTVFENLSEEDLKHKIKHKMGTVGCVAMDIYGNIVSGTSTGGIPKKLPGRVGDVLLFLTSLSKSPIIGSGTYSDAQVGGASATGWGESILKVQLTGTAMRFVEWNFIPSSLHTCIVNTPFDNSNVLGSQSVNAAIDYLQTKVEGLGGLISITKTNNSTLPFYYAISFNTNKMAYAYFDIFKKQIISTVHSLHTEGQQ